MKKKIKVLVIDDSAVVRKIISTALEKYEDIEVVGTAQDPFVARDKILSLRPDVITLDVEMPRMDGITFLKKLMTHYPIPTVMVSSLTQEGCNATLKALEIGAVDYIAKPNNIPSSDLNDLFNDLYIKVKAASRAKVRKNNKEHIYKQESTVYQIKNQIDQNYTIFKDSQKIIVIGASTGGTEALKEVLIHMPPESPGIAIVQHMPSLFTCAFAKRLDSLCSIAVKEGKNGDSIKQGQAIIAPGNYHMKIRKNATMYYIETNQESPVNHQRPSVDVLFDSVAKCAGENAIGVIMTGMGNDGASGLLRMKESGAKTIAQDKDSCVVFGMPKEAIKLGAVDIIAPLLKIPETIFSLLNNKMQKNINRDMKSINQYKV